MLKNHPKLSLFMAAYCLVCGFNVYVLFDSHDGYQTFGAVIMLVLMAALYALILLTAALFSTENRRVYLWSLCIVALPLVAMWLKEERFFENHKDEVEVIQLK